MAAIPLLLTSRQLGMDSVVRFVQVSLSAKGLMMAVLLIRVLHQTTGSEYRRQSRMEIGAILLELLMGLWGHLGLCALSVPSLTVRTFSSL